MSEVGAAIAYLRSPLAIRARCEQILEVGLAGNLRHFTVQLEALPQVIARVAAAIHGTHYHGHRNRLRAGGVDRVAQLDAQMAGLDQAERDRAWVDLVTISVLLDAAAGETWRYREPDTSIGLTRSEGLAVATLHAFRAGLFSSDPAQPLRADANGLRTLDPVRLAAAMQATVDNPLPALEGRAKLLRGLGGAVALAPRIFRHGRPGGLVDALRASGPTITAPAILGALIEGLAPVWPGATTLGDVNLGDVWRHPHAGGTGPSEGLVPLHGPTQWLAYSLFEPLEAAGITVQQPGALTGLPEVRNAGLFVDLGVLVPKHAAVRDEVHPVSAEPIVEWRALTVALLDRVADGVQKALGKSAQELPLACILDGTWTAGRAIAAELRLTGAPPIRIVDGAVL